MLHLTGLRVDFQTTERKGHAATHRKRLKRRLIDFKRVIGFRRRDTGRAFAVELMTIRVVLAGLHRGVELAHRFHKFRHIQIELGTELF